MIDMNLVQLEKSLIIETSGMASRIIIGNTLLSLMDAFEERGIEMEWKNHIKKIEDTNNEGFARCEDVGITTITITFSENDRAFIDSLVATLHTNINES
jgi:hypothetical protein